MKKMIFLLLAALLTTAVSAQDYYTTKRNVEELVPVTRRNIVMLGNSLTERGFWSEYFPDKRVLNRGIGGDRIVGMLARLDPIVGGQPRAIFIMAGVNDLVFTDISNEDLLGQYERMLDIIADKSPRTKVYIQSALPVDESRGESLKGKNVRIAEFNALLQRPQQRADCNTSIFGAAWPRTDNCPKNTISTGFTSRPTVIKSGSTRFVRT